MLHTHIVSDKAPPSHRGNGGREFNSVRWRLSSGSALSTTERTRLIGTLSRAPINLALGCELLPAGSYTFCLGLENFLGFQGGRAAALAAPTNSHTHAAQAKAASSWTNSRWPCQPSTSAPVWWR